MWRMLGLRAWRRGTESAEVLESLLLTSLWDFVRGVPFVSEEELSGLKPSVLATASRAFTGEL